MAKVVGHGWEGQSSCCLPAHVYLSITPMAPLWLNKEGAVNKFPKLGRKGIPASRQTAGKGVSVQRCTVGIDKGDRA